MHLKHKGYNLILCILCTSAILCIVLCVICGFGQRSVARAADIKTQEVPNICITLNYNGHSFIYNSNNYLPKVYNFLQQRGLQKNNRTGSHLQRAKTIEFMVKNKIPIEDAFSYMFFGWQDFFSGVVKSIDKPPVDATLTFNANTTPCFIVTHEQVGYKLNKNEVLHNILSAMHKTDCIVLNLKPKKLLPAVYHDELIKQTQLLSSFSTSYQHSTIDRKTNIKLALKNFNGLKVLPKQTISFNQTTGKRTESAGYRQAHMILDGEYIDAVGGGVCQASTTLYNALLLAGVQIDEVHSHSLPSSYIDLGFDAMVNYGTSDLRFTNQFETPIYLRVCCLEDKVIVEVYGQNYSQNVKIKRVSQVISTIPPPNDKIIVDTGGEYINQVEYSDEWFYKKTAKPGYKVKAFLEYYKNNILVKRKCIKTVTYKSQQGIKIYGAKNRKPEFIDDEFLETLGNILGKKQ